MDLFKVIFYDVLALVGLVTIVVLIISYALSRIMDIDITIRSSRSQESNNDSGSD